MSKKHQPILENKTFGHIVAVAFFIILGYSLFIASSNINYIWKWNSVPKYFAYQQLTTIQAPFDGKAIVKNGSIEVKGASKTKSFTISKDYKILVDNNDVVYQDDDLASYTVWKKGPLINGLIVTLKISAVALVIAFILASFLAFMRISNYHFLKDIATLYIAVIRGTPLLVQIFIFYFIIATIFNIERFYAGAISLGLFYGAYIAEVLRGAIQSIDIGQTEAAKSLGMNYVQTMANIVMPQAFKRALPTLVGETIALVKDSSLVSVISITDLTKVGREIVANTFTPFETWLVVAAIYFSITFSLSIIGRKLENRMKKQGGM
ncbi:MAG: amino acid ABC transporter permease [Epsilonproteobacteria bacterium]|nr:amino acid ABC transporter permease [Campylobacterota bacterium]